MKFHLNCEWKQIINIKKLFPPAVHPKFHKLSHFIVGVHSSKNDLHESLEAFPSKESPAWYAVGCMSQIIVDIEKKTFFPCFHYRALDNFFIILAINDVQISSCKI